MEEIWKPVKGREEYYEVSNTGKLRSLIFKDKPTGIYEMKPYTDPKGYKSLELSKPFLRKCLVHRLVAEAFCEKPEGCDIVNHLDNNPSNNHYTNLEWTTYSGNLKHAQNQGRLFDAQSKGGRTTGDRATEALYNDAKNMIGKTYGDLTVTALGETVKYGIANRPRLIAECVCGEVSDYDKIQLQKNKVTCCRKCSSLKMGYDMRQRKIDSLKNVVVNDLQFTGNSNNSPLLRAEDVTVELLELSTGNTIHLPYTNSTSKRFLSKHKDIV